ncbi:tetratricopeptide repeat protein [Tautonia sp. JC769]|uniref:tetratricopeptide repeat protein n=1 Tax=Tautonia sp. JC769 TaxID=3232135 RepID=UPI00345A8AC7
MIGLVAMGVGIAWALRPVADGPGGPEFAPTGRDPRAMAGDEAAWLRRIDHLRVEDRPIDAVMTGWDAYRSVSPGGRPAILKAMTLALLADVPEGQGAASLRRRIEADPDDVDARVALLRRSLSAAPPPTDRPRIGRSGAGAETALEDLTTLLGRFPDHPGVRGAAIDALLDSGRIDEARSLLEAWPPSAADDPRRLRLQARLDLDFEGRPDRAIEAIAILLRATPHDWRLRSRLSRALAMQGEAEEARRQAAVVDRLRERLEPDRLGRRLADALRAIDDPEALDDLADLCASVGLTRLASAWGREAETLRAALALRDEAPGRP